MGIEPFMILIVARGDLFAAPDAPALQSLPRVPYEPEGREKDVLMRAIGWSGQIYKASAKGCPEMQQHGLQGPRWHPRIAR